MLDGELEMAYTDLFETLVVLIGITPAWDLLSLECLAELVGVRTQ